VGCEPIIKGLHRSIEPIIIKDMQPPWLCGLIISIRFLLLMLPRETHGACLTCPSGQYTSGCTTVASGTCTSCVICKAGEYTTCGGTQAGACVVCPTGTMSPGYFPSATFCLTCSSGYYAPITVGGSTSCVACAVCPAGQYMSGCANANAGACTACQTGTYSTGTGMTACYDCQACGYGWYVAGCAGTSAGACASCPSGTYSDVWSASTCKTCAACPQLGLYLSGCYALYPGTCTACLAGTYSNVLKTTACVSCSAGTYAASSGASTCVACAVAPPGSYLSNCGTAWAGSIRPCPAGTYSNAPGVTACTACASGSYVSVTGATVCSPWQSCASGAFNLGCNQTASGTCVLCPNKTYTPGSGYTSCLQCAQATYTPNPGATACLPCVACAAGLFSPCTEACQPCPSWTYAPSSGSSACLACAPCPTGSASSCGGGSQGQCLPCPLGTFVWSTTAVNASACNTCAPGTYSASNVGTSCTACIQGTYASTASASACSICAGGSYVDSVGASACGVCPNGTYSYTKATVCLGCVCSPGSFFSVGCGAGSAGVCTTCGSGLYSTAAQATRCLSCPDGTYGPVAGATSCVQCASCAGNAFTSCKGASAGVCAACPAGSYAGANISTVCTTCPAGCNVKAGGCSAGYYMPVPAFTTCVACKAGTYSTGSGQLDAIEWDMGTYSFSSALQSGVDCKLPALDAEGGWCPSSNVGGSEWVQLDLGAQPQQVRGIITQGRATASEWVLSFNVGYSLDGVLWTVLGPFQSRTEKMVDSYTRVLTMLPAPQTTRYLRLWPLTFNAWPSLRWNALVSAPVCKACDTGLYSLGINVSTCAACATPPANGYYFASECDSWKCNVGFYRSKANVCERCRNSSLCAPGQFRPLCTDGLGDTQTCDHACTNRASSAQAVYLGPAEDNTESTCPWGCTQGYFKNAYDRNCAPCPPPCDVGKYATAACVSLSSELLTPPACGVCAVPDNAQATGPGTIFGNASSCPFQCNAGYFWKPPFNCTAWTAVCAQGFGWNPGTALADATCTPCPHQGDPNYVFFMPNSCRFTCGVGWESLVGLNATTLCQGCAAGKYKNNTLGVACEPCPPSQYQENPAQPDCKPVPRNGAANALGSDFTCNNGFFRQVTDFLALISCAACPGNPVQNAQQAIWSQCGLVSLTCNLGYYRNWTSLSCLACGTQPPPNSNWAPYNASAFCPTCTSTLPVQDWSLSCSFTCNAGYYLQNYACVRCATVSCSAGLYPQLCTGGATQDVCMNCSYQLSSNQMWAQEGCQWQCAAGFTAIGASCSLCAVGTYKTAAGNQTCAGCGPGRFAVSALSCMGCMPGTYTNKTAASVCSACPSGQFVAQSNATACYACDVTWPNSYASSMSTSCTQCDWTSPYSANGSTCGYPPPPCPGGYFLPYQGTACLLCPQGTFCAPGQPPVFCLGPYSKVPALSAADCLSTNGVTPLTICDAYMTKQ